ncbi:MAG: hypothetical protein B1H06_05145 [Candidatus Cloacimonas sp. 4484_143]|nr:MAG: hypothetical protein B1H06_05145 [Candidatus Cloacimonas sp. 4484_143]
MNGFWSKVIPIIIIFFLGYFLKKIKLFTSSTADTLLKIVFYVTLPALTFLSGYHEYRFYFTVCSCSIREPGIGNLYNFRFW